jgi:hypothetical protein
MIPEYGGFRKLDDDGGERSLAAARDVHTEHVGERHAEDVVALERGKWGNSAHAHEGDG